MTIKTLIKKVEDTNPDLTHNSDWISLKRRIQPDPSKGPQDVFELIIHSICKVERVPRESLNITHANQRFTFTPLREAAIFLMDYYLHRTLTQKKMGQFFNIKHNATVSEGLARFKNELTYKSTVKLKVEMYENEIKKQGFQVPWSIKKHPLFKFNIKDLQS